MNLKLVKLSKEYEKEITDMLDEWVEYNNTHKTDHSPWAIFSPHKDFDEYIKLTSLREKPTDPRYVPSSLYYAYDDDRNIMVGAVHIRHYLNDNLLKEGGHIGDGIRPTERNKGYGTLLVKLALEECKRLNIKKVLMTCSKTNIASAKTIINNGGILENEIISSDGILEQRYWIDLE